MTGNKQDLYKIYLATTSYEEDASVINFPSSSKKAAVDEILRILDGCDYAGGVEHVGFEDVEHVGFEELEELFFTYDSDDEKWRQGCVMRLTGEWRATEQRD